MAAGQLITIEGIDGAGKSTLAAALGRRLTAHGIDVRVLREPGGVDAAERIREVVKDPSLTIGARCEALLYAAARAQLVDEALGPLLAAGTWVLLDRFVDSSLAYQGAGRELGIEAIAQINGFAIGPIRPARTLLLTITPEAGRGRAHRRGEPLDRLEREQDEFFARIVAGYDQLAAADPDRIRRIDATQDPDAVVQAAWEALSGLV